MIYWGTKTVAVPTGETIKEQLEMKGISQKDFAYRMGMSKKHICKLLAGDVILTPETALKLEEVLNIDAKFWLGLEADYREDLARAKAENELSKSEEIEYLKKIPYVEMARCGWLPKNEKNEETILHLRKFFSVVKLTLVEGMMPAAAYSSFDGNKKDTDYPLMCWIGMAQRLSWEIQTDKIHIAGIKKILPQLKEMTKETPSVFLPKLKELLAKCGIAFVMADHLKGLAIKGAAFYNGGKIVLGLTMNCKDNNEFWLNFFHELAHIMLGHIKQNGTTKEDEEAVEVWVKEHLTVSKKYSAFIAKKDFSENAIIKFAEKCGISAGIVAGLLQREGLIKYSERNSLKLKYKFPKIVYPAIS